MRFSRVFLPYLAFLDKVLQEPLSHAPAETCEGGRIGVMKAPPVKCLAYAVKCEISAGSRQKLPAD
ncbi:hypothetical protein MB02_13105 [Croceicoccus estronivorus]|nr:hypothetical protein MB02_13105 [Croceicoccus estronivorus]